MRFHSYLQAFLVGAFVTALVGLCACFPPSPAVKGLSAVEWRATIESRRGSIVAVNVWATWCKECVEDFPAFVELQPRYRDRGVEFLTLSLDDVGPAKDVAPVERFLRLQATGMSNYILTEPLPDSLELLEISGVPAVLIYRPDGSVVYRIKADDFENRVEQGDIVAAIETLLPEPLPRNPN